MNLRYLSRTVVAHRLSRASIGAAMALAVAGCNVDELLQVEDPSVVTPGTIRDPSVLPTVLAGAIGDFAAAYSGTSGTEGQILTSGLLADEWLHSGTFPTRVEVDKRNIQVTNATMQGVFRNLSIARVAAERAATLYEEIGDDAQGQALALGLAGYSYILFGENYCNGVPFTEVDEGGNFIYGAPLPNDSAFARAIERFDEALALAEVGSDEHNLALVGKARAQLDRDDVAAAAVTAAQVSDDFEYRILHSENTGRQNNGVYIFNFQVGRWTVADNEGGNGLPFLTDSLDPRVRSERATTAAGADRNGFDGQTPLFVQLIYPGRDASIPLASKTEARLIEAEAALRAGGYSTPATGTLAILNELRDQEGLAPLPPVVGTVAQEDQFFQERAYWLFLTGHRQGDMRRLVRHYGRLDIEVYPVGEYPSRLGYSYGNDVNVPIPVEESASNPNFTGCISRDA